jgi:hypothetical protein
MHYFIRILAVCVMVAILAGCSEKVKPSIAETEPLLKSFLIGEKARTCGGTVSIDQMTITRIGDYEDKYGGWPVYAMFAVTCVEGTSFNSWTNDDTSSTKWASIVREKGSGGYECYIPELFRVRENDLGKQMDRLPTDMTPKTR